MDFQRIWKILTTLEYFDLAIVLLLTAVVIVGGLTATVAYGRLVLDEWRSTRSRQSRRKTYIEGHTKVHPKAHRSDHA